MTRKKEGQTDERERMRKTERYAEGERGRERDGRGGVGGPGVVGGVGGRWQEMSGLKNAERNSEDPFHHGVDHAMGYAEEGVKPSVRVRVVCKPSSLTVKNTISGQRSAWQKKEKEKGRHQHGDKVKGRGDKKQ